MLRRVRGRIRRGTRRQRPAVPASDAAETLPTGTFCCLGCRLLQAPTTSCLHCGAAMVAPIPLIRDLLRYRDMSLSAERDLGLITALITGGSVMVPMLAPFAVASLAALLIRRRRSGVHARLAAQDDVSPVVPTVASPAPGALTRSGVVRPLYGCAVGSIFDRRPMVVEDIGLLSRGALGGTLFRALRSAPFVLELDDDDPVVIAGVVRWVSTTGVAIRSRRLDRGDGVLAELGLPADLKLDANLIVDGVTPDGAARIEASGVITEQRVPELATYRDGAPVRVMRGDPGRPVLLARSTTA